MACNACGLDTHSRRSSKLCRFYKPKKADQGKEDGKFYPIRCVKTNISSFVVHEPLLPVIESVVEKMSRATYFASLLGNLIAQETAGELFLRNEPTVQWAIDLIQVCAGSTRASIQDRVQETYQRQQHFLLPARIDDLDYSYRQLIVYAARQYLSNSANHIATNLKRWMTQWCRWKLRNLPIRRGKDACLKKIISALEDGQEHINSFPRFIERMRDPVRKTLLIDRLTRIHRKAFNLLDGMVLEETEVQNSWWKYLPAIRRLLVHVDKNKHRSGKQLRRFTLLPIYSFQRRHITIDSTILYHLWRKCGFAPHERPTKADFDENFQIWWERSFAIHKYETVRKTFRYMVMTDGVAISVQHNLAIEKNRPRRDRLDFLYWNINERTRVIGIDPGRKDVVVAVDNSERQIRISTRSYYQLTGYRQRQFQKEVWLHEEPDIERTQRSIPLSGTANVDIFREFLAYVSEHFWTLFRFYGNARYRKHKLSNYIGKQKAVSILCKRLVPDPRNTVVAFGNANFCSSSIGYCAGPVRLLRWKLREWCRVWNVNEFRTSKNCSKCEEAMEKHQRWGLRVCQRCRTLWNRDVNAARNIRNIFIHMYHNQGARPAAFTRNNEEDEEEDDEEVITDDEIIG